MSNTTYHVTSTASVVAIEVMGFGGMYFGYADGELVTHAMGTEERARSAAEVHANREAERRTHDHHLVRDFV